MDKNHAPKESAGNPVFITLSDACKRYSICYRTGINLVNDGILPHVRIRGGNRIRIPVEQADKAMFAGLEGGRE